MEKRGQITTFIIVGVVAVIAILVLFFLRNSVFETIAGADRVDGYLKGQMNNIDKEVTRCVDEKVKNDLDILGKQGGFFEPKYYLNYYGNKISYLCMDVPPDLPCRNTMLTKEEIEKQLNDKLKSELKTCVDLASFNAVKLYDYDLIYDMNNLDVVTNVNIKNVLVNVSFPVEIKKNEFDLKKNNFINIVNIPMGEVISVVNDILNYEAVSGNFNTLSYDLLSINTYLVKKYSPFGNKLYTVQIKDYNYMFQFAIEGKK